MEDNSSGCRSDDDPSPCDDCATGMVENTHEQSETLKWRSGASKSLRGSYGNGSRTTIFRQQQHQAMLRQEASKHYSIKAMFERQAALNISGADRASEVIPLNKVDRGQPLHDKRTARLEDSKALKRLIDFPTEQKKKYGYVLSQQRNFYRRHLMVLSFLWALEHRNDFPGMNRRRELAKMVAISYNKGSCIARRIVQWEKLWVECRTIPEKKAKDRNYNTIWMNEEDITCAVRDFARSQGERK
jgi:hypothetical protein